MDNDCAYRLLEHIFSHCQIYVALSRVRWLSDVCVKVKNSCKAVTYFIISMKFPWVLPVGIILFFFFSYDHCCAFYQDAGLCYPDLYGRRSVMWHNACIWVSYFYISTTARLLCSWWVLVMLNVIRFVYCLSKQMYVILNPFSLCNLYAFSICNIWWCPPFFFFFP